MARKFIQLGLAAASIVVAVCLLLVPAVAVAEDDTTITANLPENIPPAAVSDLAVIGRGHTSLTLTWTAPGDDDNSGTAKQYDIRYSTSAINTQANWQAATAVSDAPTPKVPGLTETFTITGLSSGTRYYFALKTADEVPNWSGLSNSPLGITSSPISYALGYAYFAGQTSLWGKISQSGIILRSVTAKSFDGLLSLRIDKGTTALTRYSRCLRWIGVYEVKGIPLLPAYFVSLIYDLQPDGATFNSPATLSYSYDLGHIPEDADEEGLVIAYYDRSIGQWLNLDSVVDTEAKIITAKISHFTQFAVFAYKVMVPPPIPVAPAIFECSALDISPSQVEIGETVTISLLVANIGGKPGSCEVILKINGEVETKYVTLLAGTSKPISFTIVRITAGIYLVDINGLTGTFEVRKKPVPAPSQPLPSTPIPTPEKPFNWPLLGGIIGGVIVVGLLIFFLIKLRR